VLVKWFAVVLFPVLLAFYWGQVSFRRLCLFCLGFVGVLVVGFLPFLGAGVEAFSGLSKFLLFWKVNASFYGVVHFLVGFFVEGDLALVRVVSRGVVAVLFSGFCLGLCWFLLKFKDFVSFAQVCCLVLLMLLGRLTLS